MKKSVFSIWIKSWCVIIAVAFGMQCILPAGVAKADILSLPAPGSMVQVSQVVVPALLRGLTVYPDNPFKFDFIVDSGSNNSRFTESSLRTESQRLINYFLASMTLPQKDLWVNLSPNEPNRIVPDNLGKTEFGRDLLAQDYVLKQLTATLMQPDGELGRELWDRIYERAQQEFGTTDIPLNTFNKVWILPESATIYEHENTVYITEAKLKVMLDEDYKKYKISTPQSDKNSITSLIRTIILPEIEKEVNTGKNFAPLRQMFYSLILAKWYKDVVKNSILNNLYVNQGKVEGIDNADINDKNLIYERYMTAFKQGVYDLIKEEYDPQTQQIAPKKYFSGGFQDAALLISKADSAQVVHARAGEESKITVEIKTPDKISQKISDLAQLSKRSVIVSVALAGIIVSSVAFYGIRHKNSPLLPAVKRPETVQVANTPKTDNVSAQKNFCRAAYGGNLEEIKRMLASGEVDINAQYDGLSALMYAINGGQKEVADYLIENNASLKGALVIAAQEKNLDLINTLLRKNMDVNEVFEIEENFVTPLIMSIQSRNDDASKLFLQKGADPKIPMVVSRGLFKQYPLVMASAAKNKELIELLLKAGADLNQGMVVLDFPVLSPLEFVSNNSEGSLEIMELLITKGASTRYSILAALAASSGEPESINKKIEFLLQHNADPKLALDFKSTFHVSAAVLAASNGNMGTFKMLKKHGVDLNDTLRVNPFELLNSFDVEALTKQFAPNTDYLQDPEYQSFIKNSKLMKEVAASLGTIKISPVFMAAGKGNAELVNYLLKNGENIQDALAGAILGQHIDLLVQLVARGGNLKKDIQFGTTSVTKFSFMHLAALTGNVKMLEYLHKKKVNSNAAAGFNNLTPLDLTILTDEREAQDYLKSIEAKSTITNREEYLKQFLGTDQALLAFKKIKAMFSGIKQFASEHWLITTLFVLALPFSVYFIYKPSEDGYAWLRYRSLENFGFPSNGDNNVFIKSLIVLTNYIAGGALLLGIFAILTSGLEGNSGGDPDPNYFDNVNDVNNAGKSDIGNTDKVEFKDKDDLDKASLSNVGGIDMTGVGFERTDGQSPQIEFDFDPAMLQEFQSGDFKGFQAVIINVVPLPSVLPLLGLAPDLDNYRIGQLEPIDLIHS